MVEETGQINGRAGAERQGSARSIAQSPNTNDDYGFAKSQPFYPNFS